MASCCIYTNGLELSWLPLVCMLEVVPHVVVVFIIVISVVVLVIVPILESILIMAINISIISPCS